MDDIYKNIEKYNSSKNKKILIVFDNMIPDILIIKKLNPIVTELFIRRRKRNIFLVFITQSYIDISKHIALNLTPYFIMKILSKRELQQIAFNHSSEFDSQDFMNI